MFPSRIEEAGSGKAISKAGMPFTRIGGGFVGERGRRLLRMRGERLERPFGPHRGRTEVRGHRMQTGWIQAGAFNLGMLSRCRDSPGPPGPGSSRHVAGVRVNDAS